MTYPLWTGQSSTFFAAAGPDLAVAVASVVRASACKLDALHAGGRYTRAASLCAADSAWWSCLSRCHSV